MTNPNQSTLARLGANYGMIGVLAVLCIYFSWATVKEQQPVGREAGRDVVTRLAKDPTIRRVLVITRAGADADDFANAIGEGTGAYRVELRIDGPDPRAVRGLLENMRFDANPIDAIATTSEVANWGLIRNISTELPDIGSPRIVTAEPYMGSDFLKTTNLRNVLNQIVVIAITAVGMTLVIITGGIDLSVGSLIALSAVVAAWLIRENGGTDATQTMMWLGSFGAIAMCGAIGLFSGVMITRFKVPPFIATLGVMQIASGIAYMIARGQSIYAIPDAYTWLGRGTGLLQIPNAVVLMTGVYFAGHILMSKTVFGRHIYAVGGNREAARLSGVPVNRVLLLVYVICGLAAGVGGVVLASQLKSASPTYGLMYELYVIAAVVVGGTSLAGGEGRVMGTLIGALIIAVIQNGMNLTGVESYTQKVVLGAVILGAVLLDMLRRHGWRSVLRAES